jgi:hypothetical protein
MKDGTLAAFPATVQVLQQFGGLERRTLFVPDSAY